MGVVCVDSGTMSWSDGILVERLNGSVDVETLPTAAHSACAPLLLHTIDLTNS